MKIEIQCIAKFWIELPLDSAKLLQELSAIHYDGACRSAGMVGGFIYGWVNMLTAFEGEEVPTEPRKVTASFHDLDIALKIMECSPGMTPPAQFAKVLHMRQRFMQALLTAIRELSKLSFNVE
jgi:hypothetical protein